MFKKLLLAASLLFASLAPAQVAYWPAISYAPLVTPGEPTQQMFGDLFLLWEPTISSGTLFGQPVNAPVGSGPPMTTYNVGLTDEGAIAFNPVNKEIMQIWGDSAGITWNGTKWIYYPGGTPKNLSCGNDGSISGGSNQCLLVKMVSFWPSTNGVPNDPYQCRAIKNYNAALLAGQTSSTIDYTNCNTHIFMTNSTHTGGVPKFAVPVMSGLTTDAGGRTETISGGREASGCGFPTLGGTPTLMCAWNVTRPSKQPGRLHFTGESILATGPAGGAITHSGTTELNLAKTLVLSSMPATNQSVATATNGSIHITSRASGDTFKPWMAGQYVDIVDVNGLDQGYTIAAVIDTSNIDLTTTFAGATGSATVTPVPNQDQNTGKFMESSLYVVSPGSLTWKSKLPSALQTANEIMFVWGASFCYRCSSLYLGVIDTSLIGSSTYVGGNGANGDVGGIDKMWYLTDVSIAGTPTWTQGHEELAIPLFDYWAHTQSAKAFTTRAIGEHSMVFSAGLQQFVLGYGSAETGGLRIRTSPYPWGPWSQEISVLSNGTGNASWQNKLGDLPGGSAPDMQVATPAAGYPSCPLCSGGTATNQWYDFNNNSTLITAANGGSPYGSGGNAYGFNIYPLEHDNGNGTITLFGTFAMFDPYNVFMLRWDMTSVVTPTPTLEPLPTLPTGITTSDNYHSFQGTVYPITALDAVNGTTTSPCGTQGGNTLTVIAGSASDLQAKINAAVPGDTVVVPAGTTYAGLALNLPAKTNPNTKYTCIVSSQLGSLHPQGYRVAPTDNVFMPQITGPTSVIAPFTFAKGASYYWFSGLEVYSQSATGGTSTTNPFSYFVFDASAGVDHIVFDRDYIHCSMTVDCAHGVSFGGTPNNGANGAWSHHGASLDSYWDEFHWNGGGQIVDSQAMLIYASDCVWKITNNYMAASTEDFMTGGAGGNANTHHPCDIELRNNVFSKNLAWFTHTAIPTTASPAWSLKDDIEFKDAFRVLVFANHFHYTWDSAGGGGNVMPGIRYTNRCAQGQSGYGCSIHDVATVSNFLDDVMQAYSLLGWDDACILSQGCPDPGGGYMNNMLFRNNLAILRDAAAPSTSHHIGVWYDDGAAGIDQKNNTTVSYGSTPPNWGNAIDVRATNCGNFRDSPHPHTNDWQLSNVDTQFWPQSCGTPTGNNLLNIAFPVPASPAINERVLGNVYYINPAGGNNPASGFPPNNRVSTSALSFVNPSINNYELTNPYVVNGVTAGYNYAEWLAALATTDAGH